MAPVRVLSSNARPPPSTGSGAVQRSTSCAMPRAAHSVQPTPYGATTYAPTPMQLGAATPLGAATYVPPPTPSMHARSLVPPPTPGLLSRALAPPPSLMYLGTAPLLQ